MPVFDPTPLELSFYEALGLIVLACIFVPVSRRFGLGGIIGYLSTGIAAGAFLTLSFSEHPEEILHFAEFGVVLFLFVIGLEFRPSRLWELRGAIFGRGLVQVLTCGALLLVPPLLFGLSWQASLVIGFGLALSSTALVMQALEERGERSSPHGTAALSVLLFEDLAIVPLLLLTTLLSPTGETFSLVQNLTSVGVGILAIGVLIVVCRFGLDPIFRLLARARTPEIMTASALAVVIASALWMDFVGLSYAMGAFLAGVMLSESSYRHEVEANIEPFRGLFLGLFFIAVGLSLDLESVARNIILILFAVPLFMSLKMLGVYLIGRLFRSGHETSGQTAIALSQHGEFGFVLFSAASSTMLLAPETASILVAIVTLSMALSTIVDRLSRLIRKPSARQTPEEDFAGAGGDVLIIGFGRFGQLLAQPLLAEDIRLTVIDNDADRIKEAGRFGCRVYFGDGARRDMLRSAGAAEARIIAICVDDKAQTDRIVALIQRDFAQARLLVRAYDRVHAIGLARASVDGIVRETAEAAFALGAHVLTSMGYAQAEATEIVERIRIRDEELLDSQALAARGASDPSLALENITPQPLTETRRTLGKPSAGDTDELESLT